MYTSGWPDSQLCSQVVPPRHSDADERGKCHLELCPQNAVTEWSDLVVRILNPRCLKSSLVDGCGEHLRYAHV